MKQRGVEGLGKRVGREVIRVRQKEPIWDQKVWIRCPFWCLVLGLVLGLVWILQLVERVQSVELVGFEPW